MQRLTQAYLPILVLCTVFFAVFSIVFIDQPLAQFFAQDSLLFLRQVSARLTHVGEGAPYFTLAILAYVLGRYFPKLMKQKGLEPEFLKALGIFWLKTLIIVGFVLHVFKFSFGRLRPHMTDEFQALSFDHFTFHWHWQSMPSGHSQVMFVVGTLLAALWPRWRSLFYALAFVIAFTRVILQQHFLSDILVGALIGHLGAILMIHYQWDKVGPRGPTPGN